MKRIGILGFQGAFIEHERHIRKIGQEPILVRYKEQLTENSEFHRYFIAMIK